MTNRTKTKAAMAASRVNKFMEINSRTPVYKGAWNKEYTHLKFWFSDGRTFTLSPEELKEMRSRNYEPQWSGVTAAASALEKE